jgi:hypothetical protein
MSNIKLFESKQIRSIWDEQAQRWFFAVVDVVAVLSESQNPQVYWRVLKKRLLAEGKQRLSTLNGHWPYWRERLLCSASGQRMEYACRAVIVIRRPDGNAAS